MENESEGLDKGALIYKTKSVEQVVALCTCNIDMTFRYLVRF
jgi:hypothetical protein